MKHTKLALRDAASYPYGSFARYFGGFLFYSDHRTAV